jgi:predicted deacylase
MSSTDFLSLPINSLGTTRCLKVHRFGRKGARPKAYIQAGIHADELPANLTAHHLAELLIAAEKAHKIVGEIVLVPVANPIGLANIVFNDHPGRYHVQTGQNFNRGWPNVATRVAERVRGKLGDDGDHNLAFVRRTIADELGKIVPTNEAETLRLILMRMAADADIVLDLHTDSEAELHLYIDPDQWPAACDLAGSLGASVVMFARNSGHDPFEETVALPFITARAEAHGRPLPQPLTAVVELRGQADVSDEFASEDAAAVMSFLRHRGLIDGAAQPIPKFTGLAAPFEATEIVKAPAAGIVVYKQELGATVKPGDVVAEIVDPLSQDRRRTKVAAKASGRLFTRSRLRLAWPGAAIGKIQSIKPLADREPGKLLYD